jgi:hypothetical protein
MNPPRPWHPPVPMAPWIAKLSANPLRCTGPEVELVRVTDRSAETVAARPDGAGPHSVGDDRITPLLVAVDQARVQYPGLVGELIHREIHTYLENGHRFGDNTLISRLAEELLTRPDVQPDQVGAQQEDPGPPS